MIDQEHAHRKLRQVFYAILQQFSSNGNRKSVLSGNRSFQAQNSTCSTLLQTMLLYETCIVPSRKCLWDVNKEFLHQWRSLVITTLSARAIYRQIPVSYLQTWYIYACILRFCLNKKKHLHICKRCKSKKSGSVVLTDSTVLLLIILFTTTPGVPIIKKKKERTGQKSSHPLEARHVPIEL